MGILRRTMTKQRAKQAASAVKKGAHTAKKSKVWNKVTFKLPKTLSKARTPIAVKKAIRKACQDLYSIKVQKVNTLITPKGNKKAYVVLSKQHDALEIANKIGIM